MNTPTTRDEAWLEALFRTHHPRVLAYARRRLPDADADDVVSEVFATAWRFRDQVPAEPLPWLYRCTWHRVMATHRSGQRRARLASLIAAQPGAPLADADPDLDWVHGVLGALDPTDAELLRLAAWEGLAPREIAAVLGCSPGAARVRLHRARSRAQSRAQALAAQPSTGHRDGRAHASARTAPRPGETGRFAPAHPTSQLTLVTEEDR